MKILMMGTGPFAVPTFEALVDSPHDVCGLITRPPAGSHRKKRKDINPMRESAEQREIGILDPVSVNAADFAPRLRDFEADLFVVCDYGQILSSEVLGYSRLGGINLHGSLLPKYRGAAPINWALYNGESTTGNTVIWMTPRLDGGPILDRCELPIEPQDTAITIEEKLSQLGPASVLRCIERLQDWDGQEVIGTEQDPALATKAPRLRKADGQVDWNLSAEKIALQVRAFQPWPGSFSSLQRKDAAGGETNRLILLAAAVSESVSGTGSPGDVVFADSGKLVVQTGDGQLEITEVQPSGKKAMPVADFLRGNRVSIGDSFQST